MFFLVLNSCVHKIAHPSGRSGIRTTTQCANKIMLKYYFTTFVIVIQVLPLLKGGLKGDVVMILTPSNNQICGFFPPFPNNFQLI